MTPDPVSLILFRCRRCLISPPLSFDKDNIDPAIIKRIGAYISNPEFQPEKIKSVSSAAYGLCCWCRAMEAYDRVAKVVGPKKAKLQEAEQELGVSEAI